MNNGHIFTQSKLNELSSSDVSRKIFKSVDIEEDSKLCLRNSIEIFSGLFNMAKCEIDGFFSIDEASLICDALNGYLHSMGIPARQALQSEISNAIQIDSLDKKWDVDADKLIEKLESLYEIHSFVVLSLANEFWEDETSDFTTDIIKLFGIVDSYENDKKQNECTNNNDSEIAMTSC